jgi:transcription-repair coupling factor (superfamily II helicase)
MASGKPIALKDAAPLLLGKRAGLRFAGIRGAYGAFLAAEWVRANPARSVLILASDAKAVDRAVLDLRQVLGEAPAEEGGRVRPFPHPDTGPYDRFSPQPFVTAQRMDVLYGWMSAAQPAPVVVAPWTAAALRVPSRATVRARTVHLEIGQTTDRDALVATLLAAGYTRQALVEERGELAVRGGVIDLFPPHRIRPVRIELLGDAVESLREFDPASQRSQERLGHLVAPPPRELLVDRDALIARSNAIRERSDEQGADPSVVDELLDSLLRGSLPPGAEALAPWIQPDQETLFDFLPDDCLIVFDEPDAGRERLARYLDEAQEGWLAARASGRVAVPPEELLLSGEEIEAALGTRQPVCLEGLDLLDAEAGEHFSVHCSSHDELSRELARSRAGDAALLPLIRSLETWMEKGWRVVICAAALSGAERLRSLVVDYGIDAPIVREGRWGRPGRVEIRLADLSGGFVAARDGFVLLCEEEIFGPRARRRSHTKLRETAAVEALAELRSGDTLVHREHGIGVYRGLVRLERTGDDNEFLRIEYEDGDRLFVPVHRLNLVQRYVGSDGHRPRVDKLGGSTWEKAKRQVKRALRDMARELLNLHAARELSEGRAFSPRDRHLEEFEAAFPFEETPDQHGAIEETLSDLTRPKSMDRIVCGDVGFGKTEVAMRAAYRVVADGGQVAVLVPTTVLCQQHEETFRERFKGHPVRVESLSRLKTPAQAKRVLEGLADGSVDIAIGTHRLLGKNIQFRELGLLVIDEEHRFGVTHKERLKRLRKTVDVLTLTATPIPRTLQMAFAGLRDLSVINTPPIDRLAIRTQVARWSESLIREAILRELRRGGQVFFVHNRVHSIGAVGELLARLVPEAKVAIAHGQLKERELEERMLSFYRGEVDVLLCTTIIESGLDIPRANTMLIDRADTFGLSQLYQLRGRIGRSSHRAYAYLLVRSAERSLTADAKRRLEAIQSFSELGSGFRLASLDLEIRGAGNLLGAEQSGNLAAVGFETYMEMLEETIEELRGKAPVHEVDPEIRLPISARLPEDYVPDVNQRLVLYKRLASAPDEADLDRVRDELLDRFGALPNEALHLMAIIRLKIAARRLGIAAIELSRGELVLRASVHTRIDPQRLVNLMTQPAMGIRVAPDHRILAPLPALPEGTAGNPEPEAIFEHANRVLSQLA